MEHNSSTTRQLTDSKQNIVLRQGSYGNGKQNFFIFQGLNFFPIFIKQREKMHFFSQ